MPNIEVKKKSISMNINAGKIYPPLENLEVNPTKEKQVFKHENNYGYDEVIVNPIPDNYIEPNGTLEIDKNGEHNIREFEKVNVNVETGYFLKIEDTTINFENASVSGNEVIL